MTGRSGCSRVSEGALEAKPGAEGGCSQQGVTRQEIPGSGTDESNDQDPRLTNHRWDLHWRQLGEEW